MTDNLSDKLATVCYKPSAKSHIKINPNDCLKCNKPCIGVCPAGVYNLDENQSVVVDYQKCLECGSCLVVCPSTFFKWNYPEGGCGVVYKNS